MTPEFVVTFGRESIWVAFLLASPPLIAALVVGLIISIFQAVTQIQEMTLAIIPKMLAVLVALVVAFPWLLETLTAYTTRVFQTIANVTQ